MSLTTKCEIVNAAHWRDGEKDPTRRAHVDMQHRRLVDLCFHVQQQSVHNSGLTHSFLAVDPISRSIRDDFMATEALIKTLTVTNDHAGVALIQDTAKSGRFRCEDQLQYALQVIEQNRQKFPDAEKSTLLKKL